MTLFIALRYAFSSDTRHRSRVLRIIITTSLSLAVTLLVMSMMEYLQEGRLDRLRDVQSFDVTVPGDKTWEIKEILPDASVFLYKEEEALLEGKAVTVRYVGRDYDGGVSLLSGDWTSLVIPYTLWFKLEEGKASLSLLQEGRSGARLPRTTVYDVSGIYATSLGRSFDDSHVFLPLEEGSEGLITAVKGIRDKDAVLLREKGFDVTTWKERESGLYSALLLEKALMYIVLSFLFIIILVSLKASVRRFYEGKRAERAELEVLGMGKGGINASFLLSFSIVMVISLFSGAVLFFVLKPVFSSLAGYFVYADVILSFPMPVFLMLSLAVLLVTSLYCLWFRLKEEKRSLLEVIQDASLTS